MAMCIASTGYTDCYNKRGKMHLKLSVLRSCPSQLFRHLFFAAISYLLYQDALAATSTDDDRVKPLSHHMHGAELQQATTLLSLSDQMDPETGPVYHILARRSTNRSPIGDLSRWRILYHHGFKNEKIAASYYEGIYDRMDAFNADVVKKARRVENTCRRSKEYLMCATVRDQLPGALISMIDRYALADCLAIYYQCRTRQSLKVLIIAGLVGLFLFEFFGHGPARMQVSMLFFYVMTILLAYVVYRLVDLQELKTKHLDYRALAEGMRLQLFWKLAGLDKQVADYYLRKQKTELDWIRNAVRVWSMMAQHVTIEPNLPLVRDYWIKISSNIFPERARAIRSNTQSN
jgi:hypothetical protein